MVHDWSVVMGTASKQMASEQLQTEVQNGADNYVSGH